MVDLGLECIHEQHFYRFGSLDETPQNWVSFEETPSDGSEAPIALHFYWVNLEKPPDSEGGLGEFLDLLS